MADAVDKIKNIAFWQWEYQRRNQKYRDYSEATTILQLDLADAGVADFFARKDYVELVNKYQDSSEPFAHYNMIKDNFPDCVVDYLCKWSILNQKFTDKFMRRSKHYVNGEETCYEMLLNFIARGEKCNYDVKKYSGYDECYLEELDDLLALLAYRKQWGILMDGKIPPKHDFFTKLNTPYIPTNDATRSPDVGLEIRSLSFLCDFTVVHHSLTDELCEIIYKLAIAGRKINPADEMRTFLLILWDEMERVGSFDIKTFNHYYSDVLKMIDENGADHSIWNQVATHKSRIYKYFKTTCQCIEDMRVYPLKSS